METWAAGYHGAVGDDALGYRFTVLLEGEVDFPLNWQLHGDCMILQELGINVMHTIDSTTSILCSYLCIYTIPQLGFRTDPE